MAQTRLAEFYVILEPRGSTRAAAVNTRLRRPATSWDQIAVRIRLTLPGDAFTQWVPTVEATVEQNLIVPPTAEVIEPEPELEPVA